MTTVSYPAVGNAGLTAAQWSTLYGSVDGIYNDYTTTGDAFALQLISAGSIARILAPTVPAGASAPVIKVNGYGLQVTANEDFVVPDPASTTVYNLYAEYDPALNVADGSGNAATLGPVRLRLGATIDSTGGKHSVVLYTIRRTPGQALSAITPNDYRRWVGPTLSGSLLYDSEGSASPYPRGTIHTAVSGSTYIREPSGGTMVWAPLTYTTGTSALTLSSGMTLYDTTPRYTRPGRNGVVRMTGTVKRASGAALVSSTATSDVQLGSIPAEYAPGNIKRFPVYGAGGASAEVKVTPDGNVWVYAHGAVDWVDLSAVSYQIGT